MRQQPFASPEEALTHHGVLGMRWGVRKNTAPLNLLAQGDITKTTKNGDQLTLTANPPKGFVKFMTQYSKRYRNNVENSSFLEIKDKKGERVGTLMVHRKSKDELNVVWIDTEQHKRGLGYASASMKAAEDIARNNGMKRMTLEVPGHSPDARHIYEKQGFKPTGRVFGHKRDIWNGLTEMEKPLN